MKWALSYKRLVAELKFDEARELLLKHPEIINQFDEDTIIVFYDRHYRNEDFAGANDLYYLVETVRKDPKLAKEMLGYVKKFNIPNERLEKNKIGIRLEDTLH